MILSETHPGNQWDAPRFHAVLERATAPGAHMFGPEVSPEDLRSAVLDKMLADLTPAGNG